AWHVRGAGAIIETGIAVTSLAAREGAVCGARDGDRLLPARSVIVAVGGSSYPKTGTTGDGFRWARDVGHTIVPLRPALAPIYLGEDARPEWSGVALRDCTLRARRNGKEIARWRGDLLYTHQGVSGPAVLGISRRVACSLER